MKSFFFVVGFVFTYVGVVLKHSVAQEKAPTVLPPFEKRYVYDTVPGDPTRTRIYTLSNGLKVYLSLYKDAPRAYTSIAVRAGSKNDPPDATGLAHYLEHMLFKGTDKYGTKNFEKEQIELRKIDSLYDIYGKTTDPLLRKKIYHVIDSISAVASRYAIANEYDKMMSNLGAKGTNAYTWVEQTVYINDIPSNQIKKWLMIEGERFRNPVMRLFHTELETVYEEKNRSLDNDYSKMYESLYAGLWQKHGYGTQTTIGTIEHLKNPSLKKIREYLSAYYVPNNMAICMAGDIDPDSTIKWIDETFGTLVPRTVPHFVVVEEDPITTPIVKEVMGPFPEMMMLGFRFPGAGTREAELLDLMNAILYNGKAGLIDLNLIQKQKVLSAYSYTQIFKDYSAHVFFAEPKENQSLEVLKNLLIAEIDKVKRGEFPDWLLPSIITNAKLEQIQKYESNHGRVSDYVSAFIEGCKWKDYVEYIPRLSRYTKQDVIDFANKYYNNNYVVIYKRTGEDTTVKKVEKPQITPVEINRNDESEFFKKITSMPVAEIEPVFIDYEKDIKKFTVRKNIPVFYTENNESKTFTMYYLLNMGSNHNKKLPVAIQYLEYLGTSKYSSQDLHQEFYKLACSFGVFNSEDQCYVYLSGLSENFEKAVALFEHLLNDAKPDSEALKNMISDILKRRNDAKLDKFAIQNAMYNYAKYGPRSPFTNILSIKELLALKPEELIGIIKSLLSYQHRIMYYGSMTPQEVKVILDKYHNVPEIVKIIPPETKFDELPTVENKVFALDYDMAQVEILIVSKAEPYYQKLTPVIRIFNEYFGSGMSSIMFQELRESKALAYSVYANYTEADRIDKSNYIQAYIGTQADKLPEAMNGLFELMKVMPESEVIFSSAKKAVIENLRTSRITKTEILFNYEKAKRMGHSYDIRKYIYTETPYMNLDTIKRFHSTHLSNKRYHIMVLGNKKLIDEKTLEKYGPVKWLSLEEVFGY